MPTDWKDQVKRKARKYLNRFIQESPKSVAILLHRLADPDAICSAYVLSNFFKEMKILSDIYAESVKSISKKILDLLDIKIFRNSCTKAYDMILLVDTNNPNNLGSIGKCFNFEDQLISIIDHHQHSSFSKNARVPELILIDDESTSTSEIVFFLMEESEYSISLAEAQALLTGILYDTARFSFANNRVFFVVQSLIEYGANYNSALEVLKQDEPLSLRIAKLKAAQRLSLFKINEWIVVTTEVGSYGAIVSKSLLDLGADLAIVCSKRKNEIIVSARSTMNFYKTTRIHLGRDIFQSLEKYIVGHGGGHSTAAGFNTSDSNITCDDIIKKILDGLRKKIGGLHYEERTTN